MVGPSVDRKKYKACFRYIVQSLILYNLEAMGRLEFLKQFQLDEYWIYFIISLLLMHLWINVFKQYLDTEPDLLKDVKWCFFFII